MYASFLGISEALHLDIFHQPHKSRFFDSLVISSQRFWIRNRATKAIFPKGRESYRGFFVFDEIQLEEHPMNSRRLCFAVVIFLLLFSWSPALRAHSVSVYAWVEGDMVFTESSFASGSRAAHSQIAVFDEGGNKLLTGKTDNQGLFSFKLPKKDDLKIVLRTPEGHGAEFHLKVEEKPMSEDRREGEYTEEPSHIVGSPCISREEFRSALEEVLDEKLEQMRERLEASRKGAPGLTEIFGGIGYILGLMGVAIYFTHRRKGKKNG
jgi:nickel transport protein